MTQETTPRTPVRRRWSPWTLHGDGRTIARGEVVRPDERLTWPRTIGIGVQHVVAMFGATFLVPVLTGFPPATTLLLLRRRHGAVPADHRADRLPQLPRLQLLLHRPGDWPRRPATASAARWAASGRGVRCSSWSARRAVAGTRWIDVLMPPVVTGADRRADRVQPRPAAKAQLREGPADRPRHAGRILVATLASSAASSAGWRSSSASSPATCVALPRRRRHVRRSPRRRGSACRTSTPRPSRWRCCRVPARGHRPDRREHRARQGRGGDDRPRPRPLMGRALHGRRRRHMLAGFGGGSATTTYAENIGVMAATRVYSTAAYWVARLWRSLLACCPKFGAAIIATVPVGVLGGATIVLYGLIAVLGVRIWVDATAWTSEPGQPDDRGRGADRRRRRLQLSAGEIYVHTASRWAASPRS